MFDNKSTSELEIKNLRISFRTNRGVVQAVRGINLSLQKGETLAIVGESGSGKSVSAKAILGMEAPNAIIESGEIIYDGKDLLKFNEKDFNSIRGSRITMVFQDPMSSLDPIVKIGPQLTEAAILNGKSRQKKSAAALKKTVREIKNSLAGNEKKSFLKAVDELEKESCEWFKGLDFSKINNCTLETADGYSLERFSVLKKVPELADKISGANDEKISSLIAQKVFHITKSIARRKALDIMEEVGINNPEKRFEQYPFEFSGGMRQRIVIAIAIAANPDLLICDEPTTALDVTIQAQILELINRLKTTRKMSVIFITHDLGVVAAIADRVAVMYAGKIVEEGTVDDIFYSPAHPYTWALLSSMPDLETKEKLESIPGTPPDMLNPPLGDAFALRNKYALKIDFEKEPPLFDISESHKAATWLLHPDAPKVEPPKIVQERINRMKLKMREVRDEQ